MAVLRKHTILLFAAALFSTLCFAQEKMLPDNCSFGILDLHRYGEDRFYGSFCGLVNEYMYKSEPYITVQRDLHGKDDDGKATVSSFWRQHSKHWTLEVAVSAYDADSQRSRIDILNTARNYLDNFGKRFSIEQRSVTGNDGYGDNCYVREYVSLKLRASAGNKVYKKLILDPNAALEATLITDSKDNSMDEFAQNVLKNFLGRAYAYRKECGPAPAN
jgi:hypothetical protein